MRYHVGAAIVLALVCMTVGCGRPARLARYEISGTVTHDGKPVPSGLLRFTPDFDKGNRGPATSIVITDGTYRSVDGFGVLGGPYTVEISGFEALTPEQTQAMAVPKPLFKPYTTAVDLDKKGGVTDFDVPKDVTKK
jgi:hypothetical protein